MKDKNDAAPPVTGYPSAAVGVPPELIPKDSTFYDVVTQENRFSPPVETQGIISCFEDTEQINYFV